MLRLSPPPVAVGKLIISIIRPQTRHHLYLLHHSQATLLYMAQAVHCTSKKGKRGGLHKAYRCFPELFSFGTGHSQSRHEEIMF